MDRNTLVIGSRGSKLALWQANHIKAQLEKRHPALAIEVRIIKTTGDIITDVALSKIGDKSLFTKELEVALAAGAVDLCVHSMKDMAAELPKGLMLGPVPKRMPAFDALVAREGVTGLDDLPQNARIGTGSLRRRAQLFALRKGFELVDIRGNLDTRIKKVEDGSLDGVILAASGIQRLGWDDRISAVIPAEIMTPAVGQGALALELRRDDEATYAICESLADPDTERCVAAERYIMKTLEGGCQVPLGAYGFISEDNLTLQAMVATLDGSQVIRTTLKGSPDQPLELAKRAVEELRRQGAQDILEQIREAVDKNPA